MSQTRELMLPALDGDEKSCLLFSDLSAQPRLTRNRISRFTNVISHISPPNLP